MYASTWKRWVLALGLAGLFTACSCDEEGADPSGTNANSDGSLEGTSPFPTNEQGQVVCGDNVCQCGDGIDNDGDGQIDGVDGECTGPYDDDEGSFATGIPGDNQDPFWQDCFFDGNSGAGDDKCRYHTECLTGERAATDPSCEVAQMCIDYCKPLTPNGCDCFGCCDAYKSDGTVVTVRIGGNCSEEQLDNSAVCTPCVKSEQCQDSCGTCELCVGKDITDLPASCTSTPDAGVDAEVPMPRPECEGERQACLATEECGAGFYCQLGCCIPLLR